MVTGVLLAAAVLVGDVPPPGPAASAAPAAPAGDAAAAEKPAEKGTLEKTLDRLPPLLWDKEATLEERISKLVSVAMGGVGVVALALAGMGVGLTAVLQKSPWPEDSDYRKQPRSTYIMASIAITSCLLVLGVVCVLGAIFAIFIA